MRYLFEGSILDFLVSHGKAKTNAAHPPEMREITEGTLQHLEYQDFRVIGAENVTVKDGVSDILVIIAYSPDEKYWRTRTLIPDPGWLKPLYAFPQD